MRRVIANIVAKTVERTSTEVVSSRDVRVASGRDLDKYILTPPNFRANVAEFF